MEFDQLTQEEQDAYLAFMLLFRPLVGRARNVQLWIEQMTTLYTDEIVDIHNKLASSAIVPDNTGYPNSSPMTKSEIQTGINLLGQILGLVTSASNSAATKAVGPENIINGI